MYRARDAKLNRDVALKVLAADFALDTDRLARFKREAQLLASLNHPNIAAIYGFEDSGETHALVLEIVEGETLADRIACGPMALDEALPIARQICEAHEAAHEQGIIHRDLKPANIKVTPGGVVKVLDFGLAKLTDSAGSRQRIASQAPSPHGTEPRWARGSREIFYVGLDNMLMAVDVKTSVTFQAGKPRALFSIRPAGVVRYDAASNGQRFLVSTPTEEALSAPATVVLNWPALLKK